jgi:hypothetical protein
MFTRLTMVGTVSSGDTAGLVDLCVDPRDHNVVYLAQTLDHRILRADISTGAVTTYAGGGVDGETAGYLDGAAATALFNEPYSIIMADGTNAAAPIGTMFIADINNGCIRKITPNGATVSTLVGVSAGSPPSDPTIQGNYLFYSPHSTVSFASAYINTPQCIRFDSNGDIIVGEVTISTVRRISLVAQTVTWIATPDFNFGRGWIWFDVNATASCGPLNDIVMTKSITLSGTAAVRIQPDGTVIDPFLHQGGGGIFDEGTHNIIQNPAPGYTWAIAIHRYQAKMITSGFQIYSTNEIRAKLAGDPPEPTLAEYNLYKLGHDIYYNGTPLCFPFNSRPTFAAINGFWGSGHLGSSVAPTFDDLVALYPTDGSFITADAGAVRSAGTKMVWLGHARREIAGNDLRAVASSSAALPPPGAIRHTTPGPLNPDSRSRPLAALSARQFYQHRGRGPPTSRRWHGGRGSAYGRGRYNVWSPFETGFGTSHDVTITGLPASSPTHYSVLVKDVAGNSGYAPDATIS